MDRADTAGSQVSFSGMQFFADPGPVEQPAQNLQPSPQPQPQPEPEKTTTVMISTTSELCHLL